MALIKCPRCGQTVLSVASTCPKCSLLLLQTPTPQGEERDFANCPRCGKVIQQRAITCDYCGYPQRSRRRLRRAFAGVLVLAAVAAALFGAQRLLRRAPPEPVSTLVTLPQSQPTPVAPDTATASIPGDSLPVAAPLVATAAPAVPAPALTAPAVSEATGSTVRYAAVWANVRESPTIDAPVLRVLTPRQRVEVRNISAGWWELYANGVLVGYVANSVLVRDTSALDTIPSREP